MSRDRREARVRRRPIAVTPIVVTSLVWILLWDAVSPLVVVSGVVLSLLIGVVFPLPRVELRGRFRPLALLRLAGHQLVDLVRSSAGVLALAFRFGHVPRSAIIAVPLRSRSDLYLTITAELVSLVPGSIVLEAKRSTSVIYLHMLDTVTEDELEQARRSVLEAERRVVRAFGDKAEIAALRDGGPWPYGHQDDTTSPQLAGDLEDLV